MPTIYTVGHGLRSIEGLIQLLVRHGIGTVADVRSQPFSGRAPQFNRESLERSLERAGISYVWMGDALGGRPPEALRTSAGAPDYERMSAQPETALALDNL